MAQCGQTLGPPIELSANGYAQETGRGVSDRWFSILFGNGSGARPIEVRLGKSYGTGKRPTFNCVRTVSIRVSLPGLRQNSFHLHLRSGVVLRNVSDWRMTLADRSKNIVRNSDAGRCARTKLKRSETQLSAAILPSVFRPDLIDQEAHALVVGRIQPEHASKDETRLLETAEAPKA